MFKKLFALAVALTVAVPSFAGRPETWHAFDPEFALPDGLRYVVTNSWPGTSSVQANLDADNGHNGYRSTIDDTGENDVLLGRKFYYFLNSATVNCSDGDFEAYGANAFSVSMKEGQSLAHNMNIHVRVPPVDDPDRTSWSKSVCTVLEYEVDGQVMYKYRIYDATFNQKLFASAVRFGWFTDFLNWTVWKGLSAIVPGHQFLGTTHPVFTMEEVSPETFRAFHILPASKDGKDVVFDFVYIENSGYPDFCPSQGWDHPACKQASSPSTSYSARLLREVRALGQGD